MKRSVTTCTRITLTRQSWRADFAPGFYTAHFRPPSNGSASHVVIANKLSRAARPLTGAATWRTRPSITLSVYAVYGRYTETAHQPQQSTPSTRCRYSDVYQRHLRVYRRYFAPSGSKMAAKTTSGSGFDRVFRLLIPGFPLGSRLLAVYLHAIGH